MLIGGRQITQTLRTRLQRREKTNEGGTLYSDLAKSRHFFIAVTNNAEYSQSFNRTGLVLRTHLLLALWIPGSV